MNNLSDLKTDLFNNHWKKRHNWAGISIRKYAEKYNCSMDVVRATMYEIAQEHPKAKRKQWNETTCDSCGDPIIFINKHPCNPRIFKVVTAEGKVVTGRESHFATCTNPNHHRKAS